MKITDDEREAAWEMRYHIDQILLERERAVLYRTIYAETFFRLMNSDRLAADRAHTVASAAIGHMEKAFEPVCQSCEEAAREAALAKAN